MMAASYGLNAVRNQHDGLHSRRSRRSRRQILGALHLVSLDKPYDAGRLRIFWTGHYHFDIISEDGSKFYNRYTINRRFALEAHLASQSAYYTDRTLAT